MAPGGQGVDGTVQQLGRAKEVGDNWKCKDKRMWLSFIKVFVFFVRRGIGKARLLQQATSQPFLILNFVKLLKIEQSGLGI